MAAMLPWRRSKFVLVAEGGAGKAKGKSLGPGLSYSALLSHLVRSCPDLCPEWPLERLGALFRSRRQSVELNREEPACTAWYLGNAITLQASGEGCAEQAVERIWAKSEAGGRATKMKLAPGPHGLRLSPVAETKAAGRARPAHAYLLHRITYCGADRRHPRVLAWVYRHQVKNKAVVLRCHAVLLSRAEKAHAVARLLRQTCRAAFDEFKRIKKRDDARRLQRQRLGEAIVPLAPLRRLLNGKCPYRPPPDRIRSAPRLSAIQEEEEEEEEEVEEGEATREGGSPLARAARSGSHADRNQGQRFRCSRGAVHVAGPWAAHFPFRARVVLCGPRPLSTAAAAMAACFSLGVAEAAPSGPGTLRPHEEACKPGHGPERAEVLSLARELRFCTLRGALPQLDTVPAWGGARREPPCLPC